LTVTVSRHGRPGPDDEAYASSLTERLEKNLHWVEESGAFDLVRSTSELRLQACCIVDPRAARVETWEAVVTDMQLASAAFEATGVTEGTVECRISHRVRTIPALGPRSYADAGYWLHAFWLAVICRDQERMTRLCEVSLDRLRASGAEYDEYVYHWVDALQTYWLQRPGLVEKLTAAIQGSHPDAARVAPRELLQHILYPPINLFYRFLLRDESGFNEALVEALELHKRYWTADEEREEDPSSAVPISLLAITCLAHDGGIPVEVESDYLPHHLVRRDWLGEFPT
jgi:hypothetical protein